MWHFSCTHVYTLATSITHTQEKTMKFKFKYHWIYPIADIVLSLLVLTVGFLSFYGFEDFGKNILPILIYSGSVSILIAIFFLGFKVYRIVTTQIGIFESLRMMGIVFGVNAFGLLAISLIPALPSFVDYVFVWALSTIVLMFLFPSVRYAVRIFSIVRSFKNKTEKIRTIVIGAGSAGKIVVDETRRNDNNHNYVVAVVDDAPSKIGGLLANVPIKGPISNIASIIDSVKADEVIIAMNEISEERLREIYELLNATNVRIRRLPLIAEMQGPNDKRIIDVDLEDLLCREPVKLDNHQVNDMLNGKTVLVTGAGGSIGSELVRQIFNTHPKTLILFDIYENSTYDIQMELTRRIREEKITDINLVTLIGSTYNEKRVEQILKKYKPEYIYHAAAYKHVPLMEDSPAEAIRTNVIGTYNVAKLADKYGVKKMVLVSTDKAVRPTNVMGATKRFAETIIQYFDSESKHTKYAAVRFGNVLGSNGSVVPLFKKQIEAGGPITITDKEIIRYFMTIPEAVSLILQCGLFAEGGEIFILDMGKPVKILNLAERLIRQAGLKPYKDIDIIETGLRPGEKLFEELLLDTKHQRKTENKRIYIEEKEAVKPIEEEITVISKAFDMDEAKDVKELLHQLIETYKVEKVD